MNKMMWISRWTVSCLTLFATLFVADIATAQSLSDFKDAAGKKGCDSIPYSSLRSSCQSKQRDVDSWCKGSKGVWSCEGLDPEGLKKQMEDVKRKVAELKKEKANLASKKSGAKDDKEKRALEDRITATEKEIEKLEEMIEGWQKKLEYEQKEIKERIYKGEKCRDYRQAVAQIFQDAKSKAKGESNAEIKPLAQKLIEKYEDGEAGHGIAIELAKKAISKCKDML